MTIYLAVLVTVSIYLIFLIWAKYNDMKDEEKLIARPLVDNDLDDKHVYEVITFTGQWRESSCDSKVQMIVAGDDGKTDVRTLDPGWKDTLRKGCADSYIMSTTR